MEALKTVWDFIQNEVLGMSWLNRLISTILNACGLDTTEKIGGSVQFFIYDTIKIMVLLGVLILIISYIQSYFPPERTKKNSRSFSRCRRKYHSCIAWYCNAVLLLLIYPVVYRVYKCRFTAGRNIFIPDLLPDGRSWKPCTLNEYFRLESCRVICHSRSCDCCCGRYSD